MEAFLRIRQTGLLSARRMEIFEWLWFNGPATANEIFRSIRGKTSIVQANVHARLNEMREMGAVCEAGEAECEVTGNRVILWDVTGDIPRPYGRAVGVGPKQDSYNRAIDDVLVRIKQVYLFPDKELVQQIEALKKARGVGGMTNA